VLINTSTNARENDALGGAKKDRPEVDQICKLIICFTSKPFILVRIYHTAAHFSRRNI